MPLVMVSARNDAALWDSKRLVEEVLASPAGQYPELLEQRCTREPYADALRAHVFRRVCGARRAAQPAHR